MLIFLDIWVKKGTKKSSSSSVDIFGDIKKSYFSRHAVIFGNKGQNDFKGISKQRIFLGSVDIFRVYG